MRRPGYIHVKFPIEFHHLGNIIHGSLHFMHGLINSVDIFLGSLFSGKISNLDFQGFSCF
ncbi:hypothetical protein ES705_46727 [subsurface metagenome]